MKKYILLNLVVAALLLLVQCKQQNKQTNNIADNGIAISDNISEEEQDGIKEAQEMEFEMTKDMSLGYVPKDRLINAYEKLMENRRNSPTSPTGVSALTWVERGPNTDVIGPSNGNTRGTQAATDAVTGG